MFRSLLDHHQVLRTETCSPTINKVYIGHLLVVLDGCFVNIITLTFTQRYGEHKKFCKITVGHKLCDIDHEE